MITKTKIGDLEVSETGTLINPNKEIVEFTMGSQLQFTAELQFIKDSENKEMRLDAYTIEKIGIGLKFVNFDNALGSGNVSPIRVGWLDSRSLFFNYRIFSINNDEGIILEYTWLIGKNVDVNGNEI